jgi:hypothetical protein
VKEVIHGQRREAIWERDGRDEIARVWAMRGCESSVEI